MAEGRVTNGSYIRIFLPEVVFFQFRPTMQPFKWKSIIFVSTYTNTLAKSKEKDNFHNLILALTEWLVLVSLIRQS